MKLTIPIIRHGRGNDVRKRWECKDFMLPEPILYDDGQGNRIFIPPSKEAIVSEIQFQTAGMWPQEPWIIVWVTVEVGDGSVVQLDFKKHPRELTETPAELPHERVSRLAKENALVSVLEEKKRRLADSEIDAPGP